MKKSVLVINLLICLFFGSTEMEAQGTFQNPNEIEVTESNFATVEALTNVGKRSYHLNNTGELDVSKAMQAIFDEISAIEDASATVTFAPGVYYLNAPVRIKIASIKLIGNGHGGIDIHGANLKGGTIFRFGQKSGPYCITFDYAGRSKAFPSGESPWYNQNLKVELENLSFVGYNNTGVNTADGYSRFRGDEPNFRGLHWYPAKDRYANVEEEGQRAIVLPKAPKGKGVAKCELLRVTGCYFTELYVGIEIADCDVSYINKNWFGQLTYGIRLAGNGQGMMVSDNLFADLETAMVLGKPIFSTFHDNTFAYISKCFEIDNIVNSTITGNSVFNWKISTGAAAYGSFCYIKESNGLNVSGNSITQHIDSRKRTRTIDMEPNGQSFIQFDNSERLMFSNNIIQTLISQTVVRLNNSNNCVVTDNIITYGDGGNAVAETGNSKFNFYRPVDLKKSLQFDVFKY
ncbi:NosD domain-containing protein [Arenibacter palladensis]|uniref:NosD domain-containing protein n=1 Tax=Arenibacter palladensis TaxID=237373 RepID=UPI0026E46866|nr:NosD domain-containing protein [Arenibacter palladensis]MDO6602834.1 NosD domain-containing protein [Arenibacter palladensis]